MRSPCTCRPPGTSGLWPWANLGTAGVGAAYQFTRDATSNLRQKDDCYSEAVAGFVAGAGVGLAST